MPNNLIHNGTEWFDTDGNPIGAHAGGMLYHENTYYWYGDGMEINSGGMFNKRIYQPKEDPATWKRFFTGFNVYSSTDLVNWKNEGKAFTAPEKGITSLYISGRPHVIYNGQTKKFVMWFYYYPIYPGCMLISCESDSPTGPFRLVHPVESGSFCGHVGDMNVFKDNDGNGYVIYDDTSFDICIDQLTPDYLTSQKEGIKLLDRMVEAPAMVHYKGKYLLAGSGVHEFDPTETTLAVADQVTGPYSKNQTISENNTWQSQITDMIHIPSADYVLVMCDQWFVPDKNDIRKSRYLWLPLIFDPNTGKGKLEYRESWDPLNPFEK